jgi:hypothetical protein
MEFQQVVRVMGVQDDVPLSSNLFLFSVLLGANNKNIAIIFIYFQAGLVHLKDCPPIVFSYFIIKTNSLFLIGEH